MLVTGMIRRAPMSMSMIITGASLLSPTACGRMDFDFPEVGTSVDGGSDAASSGVQSAAPCAATETACGSSCADLRGDPNNCGLCGVRCTGATPVCDRGSCAALCSAGLVECGN